MDIHHEFRESEKRILWLTYTLYILIIPAVLGFMINLIKLYQLRKLKVTNDPVMAEEVSMFWDHHLWLFRTGIITVCFLMGGVGTIYYGVGYFLFVGAVIWWFYRIIRGVASLAVYHHVPVWR